MRRQKDGKALVERIVVERVQTGVRMEKRLVKVLKALAELYDMSLGDLLEGIVLHTFDGRLPFSAQSLRRIADLKRIYGLELDSRASHRLIERDPDLPGVPAMVNAPADLPGMPAMEDPPADLPGVPAMVNAPADLPGVPAMVNAPADPQGAPAKDG
jgi:hypothetical protein